MCIRIAEVTKQGRPMGEPSGFAEAYKYVLPEAIYGLAAGEFVAIKVYHDWVAPDEDTEPSTMRIDLVTQAIQTHTSACAVWGESLLVGTHVK